MLKSRPTETFLSIALALLTLLFCISLFKNLSYPLLWCDEGDTAMFASRVLEYGYPKVHDGKNVLYVDDADMKLGVRENSDFFIATPVFGYYWAAPGVFLAKFFDDFYTKTLILRLPFALTGLLGLIVFALIPFRIYQWNSYKRLWFLVLFVLMELLSISLILQLRDMRRYSMLILFTGGIFYLYTRRRILKDKILTFGLYSFIVAVLLFLIFISFYPLFFILIATLGLHECLILVRDFRSARKMGRTLRLFTSENLKPFFPLVISVLLVLPPIFFFRIFENASFEAGGFHLMKHIALLLDVLRFLRIKEFLLLALFMKAALIAAIFWGRWQDGSLPEAVARQIRVSNFLTLFFVIHLIVIARMPDVWTRFFIVLQPVLTLILLLDGFAAFELLGTAGTFPFSKKIKWGFVFLASLVFCINCSSQIEDIRGHIYELTHRYKGPLDFVIPYIKANYKNTEDLVIATNYEEHCYMYYLASKVVIGCVGNNLKEDMQTTPDIIIYRHGVPKMEPYLTQLRRKAQYKAISFPVSDYLVNNVPELYFIVRHLYRTPVDLPSFEPLSIYVKVEAPGEK